MSDSSTRRRSATRLFAGLTAAGAAGAIALAMSPAHADTAKVDAQLSLTGVATADNPTGGSEVDVPTGTTVEFSAATLPTAGFQKLGLDGLLGSLPSLSDYQVTVDFSKLGGGTQVVLSGKQVRDFTLPKGSYRFTWTAQSVSLLGGTQPIQLDGNQLKQAGVALNASNAYVGTLVVGKTGGGVSVQLPGVSVAPSAPVVGQLPTVGVPGTSLPTLPVSVPSGLPSLPTSLPVPGASSPTHTAKPATHSSAPHSGRTATLPQLTIPEEVMGTIPAYAAGGGGGSLHQLSGVGSSGSTLDLPQAVSGGASSASPSGSSDAPAVAAAKPVKTVDLASTNDLAGRQVPTLLAVVAIVALSLVTATYARLYLLKRPTTPKA